MINIGGQTFIPKDSFSIDKNKLEERDSAIVSVYNTRAERYEPFDLAILEVGTEEDLTFSSLGQANLIVNDFTSSDASFGGNTIFIFQSTQNPVPVNVEELYIQFEWNQNFVFNRFGVKSRIAFLDSQDGFLSEVNFEDVFANEVYGNATVSVPENASTFLIQLVSVSTNPQGLQFQQLFLNSNETTFVVSIQDVTVKSFQQMLVQADEVVKQRGNLFEHRITLTEVITKFDVYFPADRIVSSTPPKTLGEVLDIYRVELELYHNLRVDWNRREDWTNTLVRQKEFAGVNFSVILQDLFRAIDAIPRAIFKDDVFFIYPDFYNERRNLIEPNPVSEFLSQDSLDYATRIKTQIRNGTYESARDRFFPSENGYILPKSEGIQKVDSRLEYQLDSGILQVTRAIASNCFIRQKGSIATPKFRAFGPFDITEQIVPKEEWDGLAAPANQEALGKHKKNCLHYEIGEKSIKNLFNAGTEQLFFNWSGSVDVMANAILEAAYQQNVPVTLDGVNFQPIQGLDKSAFETVTRAEDAASVPKFFLEETRLNLKYIPQRNLDITHHRQFLKNMNESTQIHRQRDSQVDVQRYKNTLKNLSNRMGNDIKQFTQIFTDSEPFNLGDYDSDGNVVVRVKNTFYNDYILSEYMMAEGFGNIDGETSLWKEPSAFEIIGKDITTNIIIEEFLEISKEDKPITTRLNQDGQKSVLATLDNNITPEQPVQGAVFRPILSEETEVSTNGLYLPVFTGGGGNTSSFHIQIDDPITAGRIFSDEFDDPRIGKDLVYTYQQNDFLGTFGELKDFRFFLVYDVDFEDDGTYPLIKSSQIQEFQESALTAINIVDTINKDKNAKFAVTFQQHFVTDDPNVIIGPAFSKYNRLFSQIPLPSKKVYKSTKPYSVFNDKVRKEDELLGSTWSVNESTRKLSFSVANAEYVALTYNDEIILAFNNVEDITNEYFINFVSEAERQLLNQLETPSLVSFNAQPTSITVTLKNIDNEEAEIEARLFNEIQTAVVQPDSDATFVFSGLEPNTSFTVNGKANPVGTSEKNSSSTGFFTIKTPIITTLIPVVSENSLVIVGQSPNETYKAIYNITNNNSFEVETFFRIEGFEYSIGNVSPNSTTQLEVDKVDGLPNPILKDTSYNVDFRFQSVGFLNPWFSDRTTERVLLISQLETPTFVSSSATDTSTTWVWKNNSNRTVQIKIDLFAKLSGINVFIQSLTGFVGAGLNRTQTFTGLDPQTDYFTRATALQTGFRTESDLSPESPVRTTLQPTTAQPSFTLDDRTTSRLDFTFTNNDSSNVDIYWNTTGNPTQSDNVLPNVGTTAPNNTASAFIANLQPEQVVTIFWRAQAAGKLISSQGQSTNATLRQLQAPNFGFASTTTTSINSQWGNPNGVGVTMEAILQIAAQPVPNQTKTVSIGANTDGSVQFTGLDPNTNYNIRARFLADADSAQSPDTNSGVITTDQLQTPAPSITNITPTTTGVSFTLVNNDDVETGMGWGLSLPVSNFANVTTQSTTGFSGLEPDTDYIIYANAQTTGKTLSETIEEPFKTLPIPMGTQWVFIAATTPDETLNRGFVANACPTTTNNRDWLTGQVAPSSRPVGYVIAVTSSSEDSGFPTSCTTHHFRAE